MIMAKYPHEPEKMPRPFFEKMPRDQEMTDKLQAHGFQYCVAPGPDALNARLKDALLKLLRVAHPESDEARWAAERLEEHGLDTDLVPRPNSPCPLCRDPFYRHRRSHCTAMRTAFEGCNCPGREAALKASKLECHGEDVTKPIATGKGPCACPHEGGCPKCGGR